MLRIVLHMKKCEIRARLGDYRSAGTHVATVFTSAPADMSNWQASVLDLDRK